jgi:hypothetical protein
MDETLNILPNYTPDYIVDEVKYYFDRVNNNKIDLFTLDNAISLVNLAKVNNRVTEKQANNIKEAIRKIK